MDIITNITTLTVFLGSLVTKIYQNKLCYGTQKVLISLPLGWHGKRKIKISKEFLELFLKKKCNTDEDV